MEKIKNLYRSRSPKVKALLDVVLVILGFIGFLMLGVYCVWITVVIVLLGLMYMMADVAYTIRKEKYETEKIRRDEREAHEAYMKEHYNKKDDASKYESYTDRFGRKCLRLKEGNVDNDN